MFGRVDFGRAEGGAESANCVYSSNRSSLHPLYRHDSALSESQWRSPTPHLAGGFSVQVAIDAPKQWVDTVVTYREVDGTLETMEILSRPCILSTKLVLIIARQASAAHDGFSASPCPLLRRPATQAARPTSLLRERGRLRLRKSRKQGSKRLSAQTAGTSLPATTAQSAGRKQIRRCQLQRSSVASFASLVISIMASGPRSWG